MKASRQCGQVMRPEIGTLSAARSSESSLAHSHLKNGLLGCQPGGGAVSRYRCSSMILPLCVTSAGRVIDSRQYYRWVRVAVCESGHLRPFLCLSDKRLTSHYICTSKNVKSEARALLYHYSRYVQV